jgi:hypothetical protein
MDGFLEKYKRTLKELRKEYPSYNVWSDNYFFIFYGQILEEQIINEFITQTIDSNKTIKELENRFNKKFAVSGVVDNNDIIILFKKGYENLFPSQYEYINEINKFMDSFGWFPASINGFKFNEKILTAKKNTTDEIRIRYETKYDAQIIPNEKYYYHLSPDTFWSQIKSNGLTPKSKSKLSNHPERVYLIKKHDPDEFIDMAKKLFNYVNPKNKEYIRDYYVLRIDVEALIKSGRDKFYKDPNYILGIWTYENIPPSYVEKIATIEVNPNQDKNIYNKI